MKKGHKYTPEEAKAHKRFWERKRFVLAKKLKINKSEIRLYQRRYIAHKQNAKSRGIAFEITMEEWCSLWKNSGKFHLRGKCSGNYCMARNGDLGPYKIAVIK